MRAMFIDLVHRSGRLFGMSILLAALAGSSDAAETAWIELTPAKDPFKAWKARTGAWLEAGGVGLDSKNPRLLTIEAGSGIIVNGPKGQARNLVTKQAFGPVEAHIEFLIPKGSNSGVKFEGLYEIQIFDSHGVKKPTGSDCGGIYPRAELKPKYHHIDDGIAPRVNAARPAGVWQSLDAIFLPPRFDAAGKKIANARFVKVVLNGKLIHENVDLRSPTGHAWHDKEVPVGPLLLQADHGPVAFRNVRARLYRQGTEK
jgi:hypothetical protein